MNASSSSKDRDVLVRYQRRLSELLRAGRDPDDIVRTLLSDESLAPFHDTVRTMRPEALDVARRLVRRYKSD